MVWILRHRICGHARTRPPADQRARTREAVDRAANAEANYRAATAASRRRAALAAALLRFQRVERSQAGREVALHPSQSRKARTGRTPGRLAVEQLSPLRHGSAWPGGS